MRHTSFLLILLLILTALPNCGGGGGSDDDNDSGGNVRAFAGTLSGIGCATPRNAEEVLVALDLILTIDAFESGAAIRVNDSSGMEWTGTMTGNNQFFARDREAPEEQITGENMTPRQMDATLTTCQLEEDCCITYEGELFRP